jgi:hypothetical protein
MSWAHVLAVLGAGFEIVGFSWVIADASAALYREFGEPGPFRRVWLWLEYWLGAPAHYVDVSGGGGTRVSGSAQETFTREGETDIERLGRELDELRTDLAAHKRATDQRFSDLEQRLSASEQRLSERADQIEEQLRQVRRGTLRRERRGARLFMVGIVLTLASALV